MDPATLVLNNVNNNCIYCQTWTRIAFRWKWSPSELTSFFDLEQRSVFVSSLNTFQVFLRSSARWISWWVRPSFCLSSSCISPYHRILERFSGTQCISRPTVCGCSVDVDSPLETELSAEAFSPSPLQLLRVDLTLNYPQSVFVPFPWFKQYSRNIGKDTEIAYRRRKRSELKCCSPDFVNESIVFRLLFTSIFSLDAILRLDLLKAAFKSRIGSNLLFNIENVADSIDWHFWTHLTRTVFVVTFEYLFDVTNTKRE